LHKFQLILLHHHTLTSPAMHTKQFIAAVHCSIEYFSCARNIPRMGRKAALSKEEWDQIVAIHKEGKRN